MPVLAHRLIVAPEARGSGSDAPKRRCSERSTRRRYPSDAPRRSTRPRWAWCSARAIVVRVASARRRRPGAAARRGLLARVWSAARERTGRRACLDRPGAGDRGRRRHAADRGPPCARGSRAGPRPSAARSTGSARYECRLHGHGRALAGEYALGSLPRGRYPSSDAVIEVRDPLGLEARTRPLGAVVGAVVHPRLVELQTLFSDAGRPFGDAPAPAPPPNCGLRPAFGARVRAGGVAATGALADDGAGAAVSW